MRRIDDIWREFGGNCFGLFPPSFYLTHTAEEINRRTKEELTKLKKLLCEYERKLKE